MPCYHHIKICLAIFRHKYQIEGKKKSVVEESVNGTLGIDIPVLVNSVYSTSGNSEEDCIEKKWSVCLKWFQW